MKIEDKIAHIDKFCKAKIGWSISFDHRADDLLAVPEYLKRKLLIDEKSYLILENLRKKNNLYENMYYKQKLTPESILYANLIYKILIDNKL